MKFVALLALLAAGTALAAPGFKVSGKIPVGGDAGWDYLFVDTAAHRLYVSHAMKVMVLDLDTQKVVGEIADTQGVHGIAIAPKLNRGYTSNGRTNNVTIFDLKTLKPLGQIATGQNPDAILFDAASNRLLTFNGRSNDATVIDVATDKVTATIPLGGKPEFSAADGKGKVYVNIEDTHKMAEIDAAKGVVVKMYDLTGCEDPTGLAMDTKRRHLFSVCGNKVMVITDPDAGKVIATLPIGESSDGAAFDNGFAFSSNGEGTLTVVGEVAGKYAVVETVPTQKGARTMTVDPNTHKLYLPAATYGAATSEKKRGAMVPGSFLVLVVSK